MATGDKLEGDEKLLNSAAWAMDAALGFMRAVEVYPRQNDDTPEDERITPEILVMAKEKAFTMCLDVKEKIDARLQLPDFDDDA